MLQNRYRIGSLLGQGGMGAVYRAWDTRLEVSVALKEMIPQPGLAPHVLAQLRQQFHQEAKILARLTHPNLVRVTDFFEQGDNAYLVMDFVEGENLHKIIEQRGALPEDDVLNWANQLLHALAYCHSQGVFHRDLKPQNVIVNPNGQAVLVDFGLVKLWDPHDPRTKTAMRGMGTPEYAPPEQYSAQAWSTDARSDLYSLGATMYHALTGHAPLTATDRMADPEHFVPLQRWRSHVSSQTEAAILRAMELQRDQRFQNAQEMIAALAGQAVAAPPRRKHTKLMPGAQPPAPRRRKRAWGWVLGLLLLLALLLGGGGGLWMMAQQGRGPLVALLLPTPTVTATTAPTATPSTTSTPSPTPSPLPPTSTSTPTPRPTGTRTPTPTLTPTPDNRATALQGAGIFAAPNSNSQVVGGVSEGDRVLVLGRSSYGDWFYVQDEQGAEGFSYAPRFEWEGDFESLPVKESAAAVPTSEPAAPPPPAPSGGPLELDIWALDGYCEGGASHRRVYMGARGGNGVFTYYWDNVVRCGPTTSGDCTFEVISRGGATPGTGKVVSGDGQVVEKGLFVPAVDCSD